MDKAKRLAQLLEKAGIQINGSQPWDIRINDQRAINRILSEPSVGAGESYMDDWWDCQQLDEFFFRILRHLDLKDLYHYTTFLAYRFKNIFHNPQSKNRSKQVAIQHYNLGNDLYTAMLGKSMAYTCGYWRLAEQLDQAQFAKYDLICKKLELKPGETVLELGCGFGGFAKFAAENYSVNLVCINISHEQMNFAKQFCKNLPVQFVECDYRDVPNYNPEKIKFDKVVSIGLCEHVGYENYNTFFKIVRNNIKENGLFLLHTIAKNTSHCFSDPWIQKYIFPHGMLPSVRILSDTAERYFVTEDVHNMGADYDKTLMAWNENFDKNWPQLAHYGDKFRRMWRYYLLSCAGGFRARSMQLYQFVFSPQGKIDGYLSYR
ncbi:MAG: cyclopropane fatty acyl phospholipid synthase [Proteobacteria bacterium]|nr:cyclopropane fatty acyl phospholipid synthase [Pseudomonadota bacterium]